ncbi:MAG TPA: hypothetical protein VNW71_05610 [Thermoanaerobaculia bacterium]|nr:hypothetical protein [Thermoanaerobaculia bacterium]
MEPEPSEPDSRPRLSWGSRLTLILGILAGPLYVAWIAGIEGRRIWVIVGLVVLVAGCAALAHRLMAMTRK